MVKDCGTSKPPLVQIAPLMLALQPMLYELLFSQLTEQLEALAQLMFSLSCLWEAIPNSLQVDDIEGGGFWQSQIQYLAVKQDLFVIMFAEAKSAAPDTTDGYPAFALCAELHGDGEVRKNSSVQFVATGPAVNARLVVSGYDDELEGRGLV